MGMTELELAERLAQAHDRYVAEVRRAVEEFRSGTSNRRVESKRPLPRDRRQQILALLGNGEKSSAELASGLGITIAGAIKWINRLVAEGAIAATRAKKSSPYNRYRRVEPTADLPDPYREDWLRLTPAERLERSWKQRRRLSNLEAVHDEKSLPEL